MQLKSLERPFSVSFEITSKCDLECSFCSACLSEYGRDDLTTNQILKVILRLANEKILSLFITGGEPFQRSDLPQIISKCTKHRIKITLSTNGLHVYREAAQRMFDAGLDEIQLSLHGMHNTHDTIVGLQGAFERASEGLKNLIDAGICVSVASVGMKCNQNELPTLARTVAGCGAKYFRLLRLMPHSQEMLANQINAPDMIRLAEQLTSVQDEYEGFTVRIHTAPGLEDERFWTSQEHKLVHPLCHTCTAGKLSMGILSNGDCVPCLEMKAPKFLCGNIFKDDVQEIWNSSAMVSFRDVCPEKYEAECGKCDARWTCYSARCTAYHLTGNILADDPTCYIINDSKNYNGTDNA